MQLENRTRFTAGHYSLADNTGVPILQTIVKATYAFAITGEVSLAPRQEPIKLSDCYTGEPGTSSIEYASDFSFDKQATDIVLVGCAYPPERNIPETFVSLRVGYIYREVAVFGNRQWKRRLGIPVLTAPKPFDRIPLRYEYAFGGSDTSHNDSKHHEFEAHNPVGKGFTARKSAMKLTDLPVPNIEDPEDCITVPCERPTPRGFGSICPSWQPRLAHAGTYDDTWRKERMPLLPHDFKKEFFNTAHTDLIYPGFIDGGEQVGITGTFPPRQSVVSFLLPTHHLACSVETYDSAEPHTLQLKTDRVHFDTERMSFLIVASGTLRIDTLQSVKKTIVEEAS